MSSPQASPAGTPTPKKGGFFDWVERIGNGLPDPMTLFLMGTVVIYVMSAIASSAGWVVTLRDSTGDILTNPDGTPQMQEMATSLLSAEGFRWQALNLIQNFVEFAPLGLVLAAAIGISIAERSGFFAAALKSILLFVPSFLLTPATFFAGVMSSAAVDAGYIVLPPLAAMIYKAVGRSPLVGIAAVFAGVASGFNANLFVTGLDPLLSGLTQEAAQVIDETREVNAACNWYFMIASTFLLTFVGWAVSAWFVEPRLAKKSPEEGGPGGDVDPSHLDLAPEEKKGLFWAVVSIFVSAAVLLACKIFPWGFLYDPEGVLTVDGGTQNFPTWVSSIVPLLILLFLIPGLVYGIVVRSIRNDRDVVKMMSDYMAMLGNYVVLAFFASIFVEAFSHSNLGRMLSIAGGNFLSQLDMPSWGLMLAFILVTATANLFVGSMSAKWAMLATVFVPMFMTLGVSPELTQVTYRIGDSVTNSITPLNPYLVVVLVFMQQYVKKAGLGTLVSVMLPYSIVFAIVWAIMLVIWIQLGLPLGVDGPLDYVMPSAG